MKKRVAIIGAGGHGKVIADAILKSNSYELVGFVDAKLAIGTNVFGAFKVVATQENIQLIIPQIDCFIIGIGSNEIREIVAASLPNNIEWATIIHPSASISLQTEIGEGSVILANSVINADSKIGRFCIIDSGSIVDHECEIGDFSHLSIGTCVGSNSKISAKTKSDLGQIFQPFTQK